MKINMVDKITETKEKILNVLEGKFEVTKVERDEDEDGVSINCEFMIRGKKGEFSYDLEGGTGGIGEVVYDEDDDDDVEIYDEIHEWVNEHIEWRTSIKWDDKELK